MVGKVLAAWQRCSRCQAAFDGPADVWRDVAAQNGDHLGPAVHAWRAGRDAVTAGGGDDSHVDDTEFSGDVCVGAAAQRSAIGCQPIVRLDFAGRVAIESGEAAGLMGAEDSGGPWQPRRLAAVEVELPDGVTPPGTRGRILHAALALFSEYGFYGTSIRQIAAPVEINPATLYAHYPSKEHILAELVLIGHQELYTRLEEALAKAGADPASRLAALIREHSLVHAQYPLLAVVANTGLHALSGPRAAAPLALRARCRALLIAVLDEGGRSGAFSMADPALTGIALGGLGMQVAHWFGPEQPYSREQVADAYAVLALRMVGARSDIGEK